MKTAVLFGTRPEAIKMAPVLRTLRSNPDFEVLSVSSGQHDELLKPLEGLLELDVDVNLGLMRHGQNLSDLVSRGISRISDALQEHKPDALLVHGDTSTAFAGALAAFYNGIPVGHVEAGLRTWNMKSPWPEESNRRLIAPIATWNLSPTNACRNNLLSENIDDSTITVTGNTVIDSLLWMDQKVKSTDLVEQYEEKHADLLEHRHLVLVTSHRRENFGSRMRGVYETLARLADERPDCIIVFPMHLNPNARKPALEVMGDRKNVRLIEPLEYSEFVYLMGISDLIITDSGGVQEEAPSLKTPVLVTRDTTERPEALDTGIVKLVGTDPEKIWAESNAILDASESIAEQNINNPYGDGHASQRIADALQA
ncbi:non-hydrolyzing UDP-N-acetylglucosamine 2-epimerase [Brachybacterium alimentarium]|uniref:non-hydrolyzing UDP-N-acetylglucosamine 2-epimerase n=1 Tax=Brachybacterium alimentarium TaxID=47845 RepID=UPI003FD07AB4